MNYLSLITNFHSPHEFNLQVFGACFKGLLTGYFNTAQLSSSKTSSAKFSLKRERGLSFYDAHPFRNEMSAITYEGKQTADFSNSKLTLVEKTCPTYEGIQYLHSHVCGMLPRYPTCVCVRLLHGPSLEYHHVFLKKKQDEQN